VRFSCKLDPKVNLQELVKSLEALEEVVKVRVSKRWIYEGSIAESEDVESKSE